MAGATGAVVTVTSGLTIGGGATGVGTVNLNTGGTFNTPLINSTGGTSTLNLNGGVLVAASGATGTFLSGVTATNVQAGGAIINDGGNTITINEVLSHDPSLGATADGGLIKQGSGMLSLSQPNTFNGGTTISGGTLAITNNGALSRGNVTVGSGATLSIATGVSLAHNGLTTTTLTLVDGTSTVSLLATNPGDVQDVVGMIVDGNGVMYTATGYYGSAASGVPTAFQVPGFTGNGVIGIGVAVPIPEPSTWALLSVAIGGLGMLAVRRRQQA